MIFGTLLLMENAKNKRLPNPRKPLIHDNRMLAERAFYLYTDLLEERQTGLEPATSTLARWRTTNCTTVAFSLSLMYLSDEIYNNTVSSAWQAFS